MANGNGTNGRHLPSNGAANGHTNGAHAATDRHAADALDETPIRRRSAKGGPAAAPHGLA